MTPAADIAVDVPLVQALLRLQHPDLAHLELQPVGAGWDNAAPTAGTRVWVHGDLHAQNVLVRNGAIAGIIDWGDITAGDPATHLAGVWMLLEDVAARNEAMTRYAASADEIARAKGWAILFASVLLEHGLIDNPRHAAMALSTLRRLSEDCENQPPTQCR